MPDVPILTHEILNQGMERLLAKDESGKQAMHEAVCKNNTCSENLGYRTYLNENLGPVLIRVLESCGDGQQRAQAINQMLTTAFQIGASVALLGVQEPLGVTPDRSTGYAVCATCGLPPMNCDCDVQLDQSNR